MWPILQKESGLALNPSSEVCLAGVFCFKQADITFTDMHSECSFCFHWPHMSHGLLLLQCFCKCHRRRCIIDEPLDSEVVRPAAVLALYALCQAPEMFETYQEGEFLVTDLLFSGSIACDCWHARVLVASLTSAGLFRHGFFLTWPISVSLFCFFLSSPTLSG